METLVRPSNINLIDDAYLEFNKFYASFKAFTLSKDDKDMAEHMDMGHDEWMSFVGKKEVPLQAFLAYCSSRIINPLWLYGGLRPI